MGFLTAPDLEEWIAAFNDAFSARADLDAVVISTQQGSRPVPFNLDQLVGAGPLAEVVVPGLIKSADDSGWAPNLARKALEARTDNAKLQRVVQRIEIRETIEGVDPFKAIRMFGQPMLDRETLRGVIATLETVEAPRVFAIEGEPRSGKTYTIQFLTFIAGKRNTFRVVPVDLERQFKIAGGAVRADRIVTSILSSLAVTPADLATKPEYAEEQEARYALEASEWLGGVLGRAEKRHCIVFDHFTKALLTQGSHDLVIELCRRAFQSLNLVVVLLAYDRVGDLEAAVGNIVDRTKVQAIDAAIMRRDLTLFFTAVYTERKVLAGLEPDQTVPERAVAATHTVLGQLTDGEDRLVSLRDAVSQELRREDPAPGPGIA